MAIVSWQLRDQRQRLVHGQTGLKYMSSGLGLTMIGTCVDQGAIERNTER